MNLFPNCMKKTLIYFAVTEKCTIRFLEKTTLNTLCELDSNAIEGNHYFY